MLRRVRVAVVLLAVALPAGRSALAYEPRPAPPGGPTPAPPTATVLPAGPATPAVPAPVLSPPLVPEAATPATTGAPATGATAAVPATAPARREPDERWSLHGQGTYTTQYHPKFRAAYSGTNSMSPESEYAISVVVSFFG